MGAKPVGRTQKSNRSVEPMSNDQTGRLVEIGDIDALVEHVGSLCFEERWDDVVDLHDRCRTALERGRQLWPAAAYANYRLALDAPPKWACSVLGSGSERFALGPFSEVVANRFEWSDLAPHLGRIDTPTIAAIVQERVVRGDDLRADALARRTSDVFELPLVRAEWEPESALVEYRVDRARFPSPAPVPLRTVAARAARSITDPLVTDALGALVAAWRRASDAEVMVTAVEGDGIGAITTLTGLSEQAIAELPAQVGLAWLLWAAANGGFAGRRRGQAAARADLWWTMRAIAGLEEDPFDTVAQSELSEVVEQLRWYTWDADIPAHGWAVAIGVEDPAEGVAWALRCIDRTDYGPKPGQTDECNEPADT